MAHYGGLASPSSLLSVFICYYVSSSATTSTCQSKVLSLQTYTCQSWPSGILSQSTGCHQEFSSSRLPRATAIARSTCPSRRNSWKKMGINVATALISMLSCIATTAGIPSAASCGPKADSASVLSCSPALLHEASTMSNGGDSRLNTRSIKAVPVTCAVVPSSFSNHRYGIPSWKLPWHTM